MSNRFRSYRPIEVGGSSILPANIDYKKIPVDDLRRAGNEVSHDEIEANAQGFIRDSLTSKFDSATDLDREESVVVNVGVGQGKTRAAYKLILKYARLDDYVIIIASPYQSLVNRDYNYLKEKITNEGYDIKIMNYMQVESGEEGRFKIGGFTVTDYTRYKIHVMTINCLLGNPGENAFEQNMEKYRYLKQVRSGCEHAGKKVVIFFDEIHDSIKNFEQSEFVINLLQWRQVVQKVFILSATYTEASLVVLRYLAGLTNFKLSIIESPRIRVVEDRAKLYLCMIPGSSKLEVRNLFYLEHLAKEALDNGLMLNVLCAYKRTAEVLCNASNINNPLRGVLAELNPNLLTGENDNTLDETRHNIGTTFKSGIDLPDDSIYAIICPEPSKMDFSSALGIFSDGLPSIIQSIARIRNKGKIYVFFSKPKSFVKSTDAFTAEPYYMNPQGNPQNEYRPLNAQYDILKDEYDLLYPSESNDVLNSFEPECSEKGVTYPFLKLPTLEQFILQKSSKVFMYPTYDYECYGKNVVPYIIWAAKNNQFTNCNYENDIVFGLESKRHNVSWESLFDYFKDEILPDNFSETLSSLSDTRAYEMIIDYVLYSPDEEDQAQMVKNTYFFTDEGDSGKVISHQNLKRKKDFKRTIYRLLIYYKTSVDRDDVSEISYILNNIIYANASSENNILLDAYKELKQIREDFLQIVQEQPQTDLPWEGTFLKTTFINEDDHETFIEKVREVGSRLFANDRLLNNKTFSVFHEWKADSAISVPRVNNVLNKLFLELITRDKDKHKNQRYKKLVGANTLPSEAHVGPIASG